MTKWPDVQQAVSQALGDPQLAPPEGVSPHKDGTPPIKRFNVYRNNVALSLINVLGDTFPVVKQLVGEDFFNTLAHHFIKNHLPDTPVMIHYGGDFPDFIDSYEAANSIDALSDVARLEWARNTAYYGADAEPISIEILSGFEEQEIPNLSFTLHPTLTLMQSDKPIISIWSAHQQDNPLEHLKHLPVKGEAALILRPHLDIVVHSLPSDGFTFVKALSEGVTFGAAVEAAVAVNNSFDIPANLAGLFNIGAVTAVGLEQ